MYAIAKVIYGAPITDEISILADARKEELDELDGGSFTVLYSGNSHRTVGYIGEELDSFDECDDFLVSEISVKPTTEQIHKTVDKIKKLSSPYRPLLKPIDVYVVWCTS